MGEQIVWFARGGHLLKSGPYKTQAEAAKSLLVHDDGCPSQRWPLTDACACTLRPVAGAFVWPEEQTEEQP